VATTDNEPSLAIELSLRETSAAVYNWNATEQQLLAAAPATSLPNWTNVGGILSLTLAAGSTELILAGDGTIVARIKASWTASVDAFVTKYEIRWKRNVDLGFGASITLGAEQGPVFYISPVVDGDIYVVEVRALSLIGATSGWTSGTVTVVGKTEPPADIVEIRSNAGVLTWDYPNPPADLAGFKVRYQTGNYNFWPSGIDAHSGLLAAGQFDASSLVNGTITFMVKAVDTSGNESVNPAVVIANIGSYIVDNVIINYDVKAAGFPGTITSGVISFGNLEGPSTGLYWNTDPNARFWETNTAPFWPVDTFADVLWSFTYMPEGDVLGSTMSIAATIIGAPWSLKYRELGASLYWPSDEGETFWSGAAGDLFWPADDATFKAWPGSVPARRTTYDFELYVNGGAIQPRVTAFNIQFDVPDMLEILGDVPVFAAGTALPLTKRFRAITAINLTVQAGLGDAITARVESKSASAVVVTARNASGVAVDSILDAIVQGY